MSEKNTELISTWVSPEIAREFKKAANEDEQLEVIRKIMDRNRRNMSGDIEAMEDDTVQFKGILLSYKKAYSEALDKQLEANYTVWEEIDKKMPSLRKKVLIFQNAINPIQTQIEDVVSLVEKLDKRLETINTYRLEQLIKLIETIAHCDDTTKDLLIKALSV